MSRILVVDDDRVTRHLLESILKQAGYEVVTAGSGEEALERAAGTDLVLLDVWMPGMSLLQS